LLIKTPKAVVGNGTNHLSLLLLDEDEGLLDEDDEESGELVSVFVVSLSLPLPFISGVVLGKDCVLGLGVCKLSSVSVEVVEGVNICRAWDLASLACCFSLRSASISGDGAFGLE
jgi:hypothetical protein